MRKVVAGIAIFGLMFLAAKALYDFAYEEGARNSAAFQMVPSTPPEPETKSEPAQREWKVQPGDTLRRLADGFYGDKRQWCVIASANNIENPDHVQVDQELIIPLPPPNPIANHDLVLASELC